MIEVSTKQILPPIDFDNLEMACLSNNSFVGSPVQLEFTIKSPENVIDVGSRIRFILPDKIYSKLFVSKDCEYEIGGTKYSGCQIEMDIIDDGREWIQYVTVINFGQVQLAPNTPIKFIFYMVNPWTAYPFGQKNITAIQFNSLNQQVAKGFILLNSLHPSLTTFTPLSISNYIFT